MRNLALCGVLALVACAGWQSKLSKSLGYAHTAGVAARETGAPWLDKECRKRAMRCIDDGVTKPSDCKPWLQCNEVRQTVATGLELLQHAIMDGKTAIAIGDSKTAGEAVERAIELAAVIRRQLASVGVLP